MTRVLGLGVLAVLATVSGTASAQQNWLIGDWLMTRMDPRGITNSRMAARFEPSGRLIVQIAVSGSGGGGTGTYFLTWHMTGPQSYVAQYVDYEPKQVCGPMGCLPTPPLIPMGTIDNCQFQPINQIAMQVSCNGESPVRFTRQN